MKNWYKLTGMLLLLTCVGKQLNAQTHYGQGAGTQGAGHSFFGLNAGAKNTGAGNSFYGSDAGAQNEDGYWNSFYGFEAGANGVNNQTSSFFGYMAGKNTNNTVNNVFVGSKAGLNTQANYNVFLGANAGQYNELGSNNTYVGNSSAFFHKIGDNNVAVGGGSFSQGDAGSDNCIVGAMAGQYSHGSRNVYLGSRCGTSTSSTSDNSFIGYNAGYNNGGNYNIFIGGETGFNNSGIYNCFLGNKAGYQNTTGSQNLFLGHQAGLDNVDGAQNTYIGCLAKGNSNLTNATAIGALAKVSASNSLVLGHKANVGIGVAAPTFQLHLSTDAAAKAGSPDWTVASDSRLKKNVTNFTDGLELLKEIKPVWFQYNGEAGIETGDKKFVGIIAQEMQKIAPYTIGTFIYQDSLGNKTQYLDYDANAVTYILINSVKEQQQVIEEKEARIAILEKGQQALIARLETLEKNRFSSVNGFQKADQTPDIPYLEQNAPNGFSSNTAIRYYIPEFTKVAAINIYNSKGVKIETRPIAARGKGELVLSAENLERGILLYELVIDGKVLGGRKMLLE